MQAPHRGSKDDAPWHARWVRRRVVWVPTLWSGLVLAALGALGLAGLLHGARDFLAVSAPLGQGVLVVEGWLPPRGLERAVQRFEAGGYRKLVTTGGPIHPQDLCATHGSYAELAAQRLRAMGIAADRVQAVPAPYAERHRTLVSARAFAAWYRASELPRRGVELLSYDTHARRSWQIFRHVLEGTDRVGVIAVASPGYDPQAWWRSSAGVRAVLGEGLLLLVAWALEDLDRPLPTDGQQQTARHSMGTDCEAGPIMVASSSPDSCPLEGA